jgi:very-short-patch-repair endonuclease
MVAVDKARQLRINATDAEKKLWRELRTKHLAGWKFRRQVPLGPYVVDFYCPPAKLIVELDGGQHASDVERDQGRTAWLEAEGYEVLRFWNNDVLGNTDGVLATLLEKLQMKHPLSPTLPREGGGSAVADNAASHVTKTMSEAKASQEPSDKTRPAPSPLAGEGWGEGASDGPAKNRNAK